MGKEYPANVCDKESTQADISLWQLVVRGQSTRPQKDISQTGSKWAVRMLL